MSRADEVFALFVEANPVPVDSPKPEGSAVMQTQDQPIRVEPPPRPPVRRKWLLPALGGAAAVIVAVVVGVAVLGGTNDDAQPDVAEATARTPLATVELWIDRFEAGDVAGYEGLMSPETVFSINWRNEVVSGPYFDYPNRQIDVGLATVSRTLYASRGSLGATCVAEGSTVTCDTEITSLFGFVTDDGQPTGKTAVWTFVIEDGQVTAYTDSPEEGPAIWYFDPTRIAEYRRWLAENHPEDHADLFLDTTMIVTDAAQAERHRAFVAEWAGIG